MSEDDILKKEAPSKEEFWDEIREGYKELIKDIPIRLPYEPPSGNKKMFPLLTQHAKVGLRYRTASLAETAIELFEKDKLLPAIIIARSIFETVILLFWLHRRLEQVVKERKFGDMDDFLGRMAFGNKLGSDTKNQDGYDFEALNVMTGIKNFSKVHDEKITELYDDLCEFAHPNFSGTLACFSKLKREYGYVDFSFDAIHQRGNELQGFGLSLLSVCLMTFNGYEEEIDRLLPAFEAICNEKGE